jgi:hypothetical protein
MINQLVDTEVNDRSPVARVGGLQPGTFLDFASKAALRRRFSIAQSISVSRGGGIFVGIFAVADANRERPAGPSARRG